MRSPALERAFLSIALFVIPCAWCSQVAQVDPPSISPTFRVSLGKLLNVTGSREVMLQVVDTQIKEIQSSLAANSYLTTEFSDEFIQQFRQRFLTSGQAEIAMENIYANYFTPAEVDQLIAANAATESPLSQKMRELQPKLDREIRQALIRFGLQIVPELEKSIAQQNPEFLRNPEAPDDPVRVRPEWVTNNLVKKVEPDYPSMVKMARIQGTVELAVIFDKDGAVRQIKLIRGHPLLADPSQKAVARWKVKPLKQNGQPVEALAKVTLTFKP